MQQLYLKRFPALSISYDQFLLQMVEMIRRSDSILGTFCHDSLLAKIFKTLIT